MNQSGWFRVRARLKLALLQYLMFGGLPLTLCGFLWHIRSQLTRRNIAVGSIAYAIWSRLFTPNPLTRDTSSQRAIAQWFMQDFHTMTGGRTIYAQDFGGSLLDDTKPYIVAGMPHGVVAFSWGLIFQNLLLGPEKKPPIGLGAKFLFRIPIVKEMFSRTTMPGTMKNAQKILHAKRSICLVPGGVPEMIQSVPGDTIKLYCKNKGFIRLALSQGVDILPCFAFGLHNQWSQKSALSFDMEEFFRKNLGGLYPTLPWGSWGPFLPNETSLVHVVGNPVHMPKLILDGDDREKVVDYHHERFYKSVRELVLTHRVKAGFPQCKVEFIGLEHLNISHPDDNVNQLETSISSQRSKL